MNRLPFLAASLLFASLFAQPLARWVFEPSEKGIVKDTAGQAHGKITGDLGNARFEEGVLGSALRIDDGLVQIAVPHGPGVDLVDDFTIECLVKPFAVSGYRTILWKGDRGTKPEQVQYYLNLRDGKLEFKAKKADGQWVSWLSRAACCPAGRWLQIRVSFRAGVCELRVGGVLQETANPPGVAGGLRELVSCQAPMVIGLGQAASGLPSYPWSGLINEVAFYRGAVTDANHGRVARVAVRTLAESLASLAQQCQQIVSESDALTARFRSSGLIPGEGQAEAFGKQLAQSRSRWERLLADAGTMDVSTLLGTTPTPLKEAGDVAPKGEAGDFFGIQARKLARTLQRLQAQISQLEKSELPKGADATAALDRLFALQASLDQGAAVETTEALRLLSEGRGFLREARLFDGKQGFALVPCSTGITLEPTRAALLRVPESTNGVALSLARNEREGLQLMVLPKRGRTGVSPVLVRAEGFKHLDTGARFPEPEIACLKTVSNAMTLTPVDYRGAIFDVVQDGTATGSLSESSPSVFLARFRAEPDTAPGVYRGKIIARADGQEQALEVRVTVRPFTLPDKSSLRVVFSFFDANYQKWFKRKALDDQTRRNIFSFLLDYRVAPNNIYQADIYPELPWLARLPEANFCTLGYFGPKGKISEAEIDGAVAKLKSNYAAALAAGVSPDAIYHYSWDEYGIFSKSHFDPESARAYMQKVRRELPALKLLQTSLPQAPFDAWWNVWVPGMDSFRQVNPEVRKRPGDEPWWYWVSEPRPYPNFFLGYPVHEARMAMLMGFKYGLKGCLYWCINREWNDNLKARDQGWPEAEWQAKYVNIFTQSENLECGQGNLVYPGTDGRIWPSLRFENLRDGIEDYEYLAILKALSAEIKSGKRASQKGRLPEIEAILAMPDDVVASCAEWTRDPERLSAFRDRVAATIDAIVKDQPFPVLATKKTPRDWGLAETKAEAPAAQTDEAKPSRSPILWLDFSRFKGAEGKDRSGNLDVRLGAETPKGNTLRIRKGSEVRVRPTAAWASPTKELTVCAWVAPKGVEENYQTILFKGDRSGKPERIEFALTLNYGFPELKWKDASGDWQGFMQTSAAAKTGSIKGATRLAAGKWTHLAVRFQSGAVQFYVDGEKAEGTKAKVAELTPCGDDLFLGPMAWGTGDRQYWFDGLLADVRVYDQALGSEAIKAISAEAGIRAGQNADLE